MTSSSSLPSPTVGVILPSSKMSTGTKELAKANKKANTKLFFFTTRGVDYEHKVIKGTWFNDATGRWEKRTFSFPQVSYVRGGSGKSIQALIKKFDDMAIRRINPILAFNKSDLFYKLRQDKNARKYLPYTRDLDLNEVNAISAILRERKTVYIKACRGQRGRQVVRVTRVSPGRYQYSYSTLGKLVRREVRSCTLLQKALKSFFGNRNVIVQQAINLPTVNGSCPVDFRAEIQRNRNGRLTIVAVPIRVGRKNSPITTHGTAYCFNDYIRKVFPTRSRAQIREMRKEIYSFLKTVCHSVENVYGKFGEIGIDFAIDKNRNIWLIECNAQSAKKSVRRCYGDKTIHQIYRNPLEYAKTLVERDADRDEYTDVISDIDA